jgi:adenylate cyclase class 1
MECYASEYPYPKWLSFELKNAIYQGTFDVDQLDPYLLIYLKVEKYLLEAGSIQRLNLARQCFYLKIMGGTGEELDYNSRLPKEAYLQSIAKQRNWPESLLPALKKQKYWDIKKATQEHIIIRAQLRYCLRMVMSLAGNNAGGDYKENKDLKLISRKLHVFLEKKPEKIEIITTRSSVHTKENELSIVEADSYKKSSLVWSLFSGRFDEKKASSNTLIRQENSLLRLLGWLVINGLYHKKLQLNFKSRSLDISIIELHRMLNQLFRFLSKNLITESASLSVYSKPDKLVSSLMFINLGQALAYERDGGMLVLSDRSDPLSYGKERHCFIQQIDRISVSTWGEVTTSGNIGLDNFFSFLTHVFNNSQHPVSLKSLEVVCYTPIRAKSIVLRAESIFKKLIAFFSKQSDTRSDRYFLAAEHSFYGFQCKNKYLRYWSLESTELLLQELASTQDLFGHVHFEPEVLENSLIPFLYTQNLEQIIQVFYYQESNCISVFIIDEKGALFTHQHTQSNCNQVLSNYSMFLESILNRPFYNNDTQVQFFEIQKKTGGVISCLPAKYTSLSLAYMELSVRIIIEQSSTHVPVTTTYIYCNDIEFSSVKYGSDLFIEVSRYIMDCRKNRDDYPVHISDVEVPCSYLGVENSNQLQTVHYLNYKKKIETKLNV